MQGGRTQCYESTLGVWTQSSHHVSVSSGEAGHLWSVWDKKFGKELTK